MPVIRAGDIEAYVASTLHVALTLRPWPGAADLPPYLRDAYESLLGELHGAPVLWLLARDELTPKSVASQVVAMERFWPDRIVVVFGALAAYDRQRLIQRGVNFIVPGAQLYLPDLGIDFRARVRQVRREAEMGLRPSAQVLLLHMLESAEDQRLTAAEIASVLGYTKMTMTRAVGELEVARLIDVTRTGRENVFCLPGPRHAIWTAAQDHLVSPVTRRMRMPSGWDAQEPCAGLTALAEYSTLAEPSVPVRAVAPSRVRQIDGPPSEGGWEHALMAREDNEVEIEVWSYDPRVLLDGPTVDRLSLFLSLRDDPDERVQQALQEMMRGFSW